MNPSGQKKRPAPTEEELSRIDALKKKLYSQTTNTHAVREEPLHRHDVKVGINWEETDSRIAEEDALKKKIEEDEKAGVDVRALYNQPLYGAYGHYSPAEDESRRIAHSKDGSAPTTATGISQAKKERHLSVGQFLSEKFSVDRAEKIQKKLAAQDVTIRYAAAQAKAQKSIYPDFPKQEPTSVSVSDEHVLGAPQEKEQYHPNVKILTVGPHRLDDVAFEERGGEADATPVSKTATENKLEEAQKKEKVSRYSFGTVLFTIAALFFVGAFIYAYIHFEKGTNTISPDKIELTVTGPVSVPSGEVSDFYIDITNRNNTELIQADLVVQFPDGTKDPSDTLRNLNNLRIDVGSLKIGETVRKKVSAVFFGEENVKKNIQYSFEFNIADSASIFNKDKVVGVFISGAPVTAKIINVKEITNNQELSFDIEVVSNSKEIVKNIQLKVEYPFGFKLLESNLKPIANDTTWAIGDIEPLGVKTIKIKGVLIGTNNLEKNFRFILGVADQKTMQMATVLSTQDQKISIRQPFVSASIALDGITDGIKVVQYEDMLRGSIVFANNLKVPLTDVVVEMRLAGVLIDRQTVKPDSGFYRSGDDTLFWDKATEDVLALVEPGETREVTFNFGIVVRRDDLVKILRRSSSGVTVTIKAKRLNENRVPEEITYGTSRELRLSTDFRLEAFLQHKDGPKPPQVNQESVFRFTGRITNTANAVKNTVFTAKLPPNATWKNSYSSNLPTKGVSYSAGKREITLTLGEIPAAIGLDQAPVEFYFDIGFVPTLTERGTYPKLIFSPKIGGVDSFTERVVESVLSDLNMTGVAGGTVE